MKIEKQLYKIDLCEQNSCGSYNISWMCPRAVGRVSKTLVAG